MPYTTRPYLKRPDPDPILCLKEAADLLGCSTRTVLRLREDGAFEGWQACQHGTWRFQRLALLAYIEKRKAANVKRSGIRRV
jgi:excisionase family DNA binding protein